MVKSNFALDVSKFVQKTGVRVDLVVRKIAFDVFSSVVKRTPVDTGRARASWTLAVNRVDLSTAPVGSSTTIASPEAALGPVKFGDTVYISNNLPYIVPLNNGSSTQAPEGFVQMAVEEIKASFEATVKALP